MSLKVMTWAWTIALPPAPKLVLMALADEADDRASASQASDALPRNATSPSAAFAG